MRQEDSLRFQGRVSDGLGEGAAFVQLDGYRRQFVEILGYEPYPGTLNVEVTDDSGSSIADVADLDPLVVEGWTDGDTEFGPVYCYPASVQVNDEAEQVHIVRPERTRHDEDILEILSPHHLRDRIGVETGDPVTILVDADAEC